MEEIFLKSLHPFDLPKVEIQPRRLDEQSGLWLAAEPLRFSQGPQFGELRMMLRAICLEIYCCLSVAEIGIVAWSRRTDVPSGKEVTVSHPNDERFYWLESH